jgi:hypothetical protein
MTDSTKEGGCSCGSIRYRMTASPLIVHCCHCTWCQRESGAAFALNALIESSCIDLLNGDPVKVATPGASGKKQDIWRCPECKVAVWSHYAGFGDRINFIRVGTLDEGHGISPDIHIFTTTKQPWVVIPEGSATADEFYSLKAIWPDESRARLRAALADN